MSGSLHNVCSAAILRGMHGLSSKEQPQKTAVFPFQTTEQDRGNMETPLLSLRDVTVRSVGEVSINYISKEKTKKSYGSRPLMYCGCHLSLKR